MPDDNDTTTQAPDADTATGNVRANRASQIVPTTGQRALIVGHTGSGKTEFACWMLERLEESPIVVMDTKGEEKFEQLPRSVIVTSDDQLDEQMGNPEYDYLVYRPDPTVIADGDELDALLMRHFRQYHGIGIYIDELFTFSQNGRAGPGLVALLTQGRSKKITTIMSAQRPSWLSRFAITEAQRFYVFRLIDRKDKARLGDVIPEFASLPDPPEYGFWYYTTRDTEPRLLKKIVLDKRKKGGYKGQAEDAEANSVPDLGTAINWL
jgi:hypothetical protein